MSLRNWLKHPWLRHLRIPFNLLLSPIYLWGVVLANGSLNYKFFLAYLSLHLFLYGGTTAFNSYYDKDEGPVGGMLKPPPVDKGLLRFSLIFQALGIPFALAVNLEFVLSWLLLCAIATAYSHPRTRFKAHPIMALLAVGLGQGAIGFACGWLVEKSKIFSYEVLGGMLSTTLVVMGLYIVTQSYQTKEDALRGDKTLAVLLGPQNALRIASLILGLGGGIMLVSFGYRFGLIWTGILLIFFLVMGLSLVIWAAKFDEENIQQNFYQAMRITTLSSTGLSLFFIFQLL